VLEAEGEQTINHIAAAIPAPTLAVPPSLHASLMARLDRLGAAKEVAQMGAAIGREFSHALLAAVARKPELDIRSALDRLVTAGLLFRQGTPPHATYLFKHALVQDAAYGTLLREPRRALHARIAETIESRFADVAESQPELLARHSSEAGLIEKAAGLWGKAGLRSLERSALVEAAEQLTRALAQIATLPLTTALRREEIKLQVALITSIIHVKGYAAPEARAAVERARLLIEQANARGEELEDPLLLFSVLYGSWVANIPAFNGDAARELAKQFLGLAEKQGSMVPLMVGHRLVGLSLCHTGDLSEGRLHFDQALALYDPSRHRSLAMRFGQDVRASVLAYRSIALWTLGYPRAARADADRALKEAHEIGQAATLMYTMAGTFVALMLSGDYEMAATTSADLVRLADEKQSAFWKWYGIVLQGCVWVLKGDATSAIRMIPPALAALRQTGSTFWSPMALTLLSAAYGETGKFDDASRCINEAMTTISTTKETFYQVETNRVAGGLALLQRHTAKAQTYFEHALTVAREQQAKSWELRAAMSLARLWRDQGKVQQARDLLAPVYGWFTEGFDTLDLKEAKALLEELA
jgi:predicted ATPase